MSDCLQGADLLKHGRQGRPKMHFFRVAEQDSVLTWRSANGKQRSIPLSAVTQAWPDFRTTDHCLEIAP